MELANMPTKAQQKNIFMDIQCLFLSVNIIAFVVVAAAAAVLL